MRKKYLRLHIFELEIYFSKKLATFWPRPFVPSLTPINVFVREIFQPHI